MKENEMEEYQWVDGRVSRGRWHSIILYGNII